MGDSFSVFEVTSKCKMSLPISELLPDTRVYTPTFILHLNTMLKAHTKYLYVTPNKAIDTWLEYVIPLQR
jgi:hypothetical protein